MLNSSKLKILNFIYSNFSKLFVNLFTLNFTFISKLCVDGSK